jgi:hypothetical protein
MSSCATTVPTSRPIKRGPIYLESGAQSKREFRLWCDPHARDSATRVRVARLFLVLAAIGCGGSSSETPPPLEPDPRRLVRSQEADGPSLSPPEGSVAAPAPPPAPPPAPGSPPAAESGEEFGIESPAAPPPAGFVSPEEPAHVESPAAPDVAPVRPPTQPVPAAEPSLAPPATDAPARGATWGAPASSPPIRAGKPKKSAPPP